MGDRSTYPFHYDIIIDASGKAGISENIPVFTTLKDGLAYAENLIKPVIYIKSGVYKEKLTISQPNLTLFGEEESSTILTYDTASAAKKEDGTAWGTTGSASITVTKEAVGFHAEHLTFQNSFLRGSFGYVGEQAVAFKCEADKTVVKYCRFLSGQDTLYADAAFDSKARQYYYRCYIEGDVDFVFGRAQAVFEECEFFSLNTDNNPEDDGYITAPSTWSKCQYGFLITNSRFTGAEREGTTSLGRPWQPGGNKDAKPAILIRDSFMDKHIGSMGFVAMHSSLPEEARLYEYHNYGPGAHLTPNRRQLNDSQAKHYTMEQVFHADYPEDEWMPTLPPVVSIIVPIYNAHMTLDRCLGSILRQTFTDYEVLMVNDGSTDNSLSICRLYERLDKRFHTLDKPNSGVSSSRNLALRRASGKYIQFIDSDDWLTEDATETFVRLAEEQNADMVVTGFYRVIEEQKYRKSAIKEEQLLTRNEFAEQMMKSPADFFYGVSWNKLYKRTLLLNHNLFFQEDMKWCEDFLLNLEYLQYANRIMVTPKPVYYYLKRKDSLVNTQISLKSTVQMKKQIFEYYKDLYVTLDLYEENKWQVQLFLIAMATDGGKSPLSKEERIQKEAELKQKTAAMKEQDEEFHKKSEAFQEKLTEYKHKWNELFTRFTERSSELTENYTPSEESEEL